MSESIDIDHVAQLARIRLSPEEKTAYAAQLGDILNFVRQLESVDVTGVEPTSHAFPVVNVLDDDEPSEPFTQAQALMNAPLARNGQIEVPKVVDEA